MTEKQVLILEGLDCANCAAKIEEQVKNISEVKTASLNFVEKKLFLEAENKDHLAVIRGKVEEIVKRLEPHVIIMEETEKKVKVEGKDKKELLRLIVGAVFYGIALIFQFSFAIELTLYLASYLLVGGEVLLKAIRNITRGQVFDENFLMALATVGAFAIQQFPEGVAVMLFYQIGEFLQDLAVNRSRKSIAELMNIRPDYANLKVGEETEKVAPEEIKVGQIILVKPGEKVPLDGKIIEGESLLDTSPLTGESVPRKATAGKEIMAGFINQTGLLSIQVTKEFGQSTVAKILDLVENAGSKKAPTENFITKFARYYTPLVVVAALMVAFLPPLIIPGAVFSQWLYRALIFLVISCPCALVVSIPLGFFGGIGGASKNGVLIKGGNYLEALNEVETIVFDKTGTLTRGVFQVTEINPVPDLTKEELLKYAAYAETYSNHPIAASILQAYRKPINKEEIENYTEISGQGIKVKLEGKEVLAGNDRLMQKEKIVYQESQAMGTIVHLAIAGQYAGFLVISDEIKEGAGKALNELKSLGIRRLVMLTGDNQRVALNVAKQLGIEEVYAQLLPNQKVEKLEKIIEERSSFGKIIFVGDGINDAPVLARADIGVAMGALGSDAAIEAADIVLMNDELGKLVSALKVAKKTKAIVWQNIIFAFGVKIIVLILGAGGIATMWEAVFADVGVALIAVLNAMRVMKGR